MATFADPPFTQLRQGIDNVLVPQGFAPGGWGGDDERGQFIWCAAAANLAARFPALPTEPEATVPGSTACTDLVVDLAVANGEWCVAEVSLEGRRLGQVLADLGLTPEGQRATALSGSPVAESLTALPSLLTTLLNRAARAG